MFDADRQTRVTAGLTAAGTAVAFTLLSVLTGGFVAVPLLGPVDFAVGLAVPLGLWFGVPAAVGIGGGVALTAALESALSWWTALDALAYGWFGVLGVQLWGTLPGLATGDQPGLRSSGQLLEFVAVTAIAATVTASVVAWGAVLGWGSPFHASALPEWGLLLRSTLVVGFPVLLAAPVVGESLAAESGQKRLTIRSGAFCGGVVVPALWFLVGIAVSILLGSRRLEIVVGALALSVIVATYLPRQRTESNDQHAQRPTPTDA